MLKVCRQGLEIMTLILRLLTGSVVKEETEIGAVVGVGVEVGALVGVESVVGI